jgi:hypothetical protein
MIDAALAVATTLGCFFLFVFLPIFAALYLAARSPNGRAARLKELKKYSIRPLDLR